MHSKCISNYSVYRTFGRLKATFAFIAFYGAFTARVLDNSLSMLRTHAELFFCIRTVKNPNSS